MFNDQSQAQNLLVRALRPEDLEFFRSLAQDKRITRYIGDGAPWTEAYVQQRFAIALNKGEGAENDVRWFIAETYSEMQIGLLALTVRPEGTEVGYWIAPGWWGNGYARELVHLAVAIAHNERLGLPLTAKVHRDNGASRRVLERVGFVHDHVTSEASERSESGASSHELTYRHPQRA